MVAFPAAALGAPAQVTVETGATFDPGQGSFDSSEAVALADGNTFLAYSVYNGTNLELYGVLLGPDGAALTSPLLVASAPRSLSPVHVGALDQGAVAVVYASPAGAFVALWDGARIASIAALPTGPLSPRDCTVSKGPGPLAAACALDDPASPQGAIQEVYLYRIGGNGSINSGPLRVSPDDAVPSVPFTVELDSQLNAWVAYRDFYSFPSSVQAYIVSVSVDETVSAPPVPLTPVLEQGGRVDLIADPAFASGVVVAAAWNDPNTSNIQVELSRLQPDSAAPVGAIRMTGISASIRDMLVSNRFVDGQNLLLVEWTEEFFPDPTSYILVDRPVFALAQLNMSIVMAPTASNATSQIPVRFVRVSGMLLWGDQSTTAGMVRVTWLVDARATPPTLLPVGDFEPWVLVGLVAAGVSAGALLPLAGADRFRWALAFLLGPLYGLVRRERVMIDNIRRGAILQVIKETPGIRYRELSRRTEIALGALTHHLQVLEAYGFIERRSTRQAVQFFLAGENPIKEEPFVELRTRILDTVLEKPGISHSELARRVGVKWTTLLYHVELLHGDGKLTMRRRRSRRRYWPR